MELPFTRFEFLQVFRDYNESIWPLQWIAGGLGFVALLLLDSDKPGADRAISAILVVLWTITGVGYHWLFFAAINPAAYVFGGLFVAAALIFLVEGAVRNRIRFRLVGGVRGWSAWSLFAYSLVVYPILGLVKTHPYPETPLFGVAPCPTTIFSLGLLMLASYPRPMVLAAVPLLWAAIGGSAAFLLHVPQDAGLVAAGLIWLIAWIRHGRTRGRPTPT